MSDEHSGGGDGIMCTLCTKTYKSRKELFHHMPSATHRRQSVRCPWCLKGNIFTRVCDLSRHCDAVHFREYSLMPDGFLSVSNCFYLAVYPKDYATMTRIEKYDSAVAIEARRVLINHLESIKAGDEERNKIKDGWKAGLRIAEQIEKKENEIKQAKAATTKTQKRRKKAKDNDIPQKKQKGTLQETKEIYDQMFKNEPIKIGIPKKETETPEISDNEDNMSEKRAKVVLTRLDKNGVRRLMVMESKDGKVKNERLIGKPFKAELDVKTVKTSTVTRKVEEVVKREEVERGQGMTLGTENEVSLVDGMTLGTEKEVSLVDGMALGTETEVKIIDEGGDLGGVKDDKVEGKVDEVIDVKETDVEETWKLDVEAGERTDEIAGIGETVKADVGEVNLEGERKEEIVVYAETFVDGQVNVANNEVVDCCGMVMKEKGGNKVVADGGIEEKEGEIKEKRKINYEEYKIKARCAKQTERVYNIKGGETILNEKGDAVEMNRNEDGIWQRVPDKTLTIDMNNNTVNTQESTSEERDFVESNEQSDEQSDEAKHVATAIRILEKGAMPLCPPARRQWGPDTLEEIDLGHGRVVRWPPKGWLNMSADRRLLTVEMMAMTLEAFVHGEVAPEISRGFLLDKYKFLMLPGALIHRKEKKEDSITRVRFHNLKFLKEVVAGKVLSFGEVQHLKALESLSDGQKLHVNPGKFSTPVQLEGGPSFLNP